MLGNGDDVTLGTQTHSGTLSGGASYTQTADVVLPQGIEGTRYVFVLADATNAVDEFLLDGNNSGRSDAVAISLTPPPDLQVTSITVPAQALTAGTLAVTWTVSNLGTAAATGDWTDRVYLSTDAVAGGDQLLGTFTHSGGLAVNASYSRSETLTLTELPDGAYYVVVVTDSGRRGIRTRTRGEQHISLGTGRVDRASGSAGHVAFRSRGDCVGNRGCDRMDGDQRRHRTDDLGHVARCRLRICGRSA